MDLRHEKPQSRMYFSPNELSNDQLQEVKEESRSWLYKELEEHLEEYFNNNPEINSIEAIPKEIKMEFFEHHSRVEINYLRKVLKDEFGFEMKDNGRYTAVFGQNGVGENKKTGTPFVIPREYFIQDENSIENDDDLPF